LGTAHSHGLPTLIPKSPASYAMATACAYGNAVPMRDLISDTSLPLMAPLAFTSERKFADVRVCPIRDFVCDTSLALTVPLPLLSPTSTLIGITTLLEPFTL